MSTSASMRTRRAHERASWPARSRSVVCLVAALVLVAAVGDILSWLFHIELFVGMGPGRAVMKFSAAVGFALISLSLLVSRPRPRTVLVALAMLVGALILLEYLLGRGLGIDELVVKDWASGNETAYPGRPSEPTAFALLCLGLSGLLADLGRRGTAQLMAGVPLLVGMTAIFGYLYGVDGLYQVGTYSTMAVSSGIAVTLLGLASWLAVPHGILQWIVLGTDTGARLQRVLVPVAVILLPLVGWLYITGLNHGWWAAPFGTAVLISFVALVVVVVGYRVGRAAFRLDAERDTLLDELHEVNSQLEDRVRSRSHQLNRQRTKLALFEERDRIARDLHDRVIQRIFAAGLQVASLSRAARKEAAARDGQEPAIADSLNTVATELDLAIRELRNSIFELTSIEDHDNLEQVVRDIAARAARILGFMPRVEVSGPTAGVPADLVAQIASVMQEGLSNVARHAQASAAEVCLEATETELQVRITDNGVGLPDPLPRSSGINNLMNRARQLGGSATWSNASPEGTVLVWRVPREHPPHPVGQGNETSVAFSESVHSPAASAGS